MHRAFDEETGGKWHDAVEDAVLKDEFEILWYRRDRRGMRQRKYRALYRDLSLRTRAGLLARQLLPGLFQR